MHVDAVVHRHMLFRRGVPLLLTQLLLASVACGQPRDAQQASGPRIAFSLSTSDGQRAAVPTVTASATVVEFFSPSCEPCSHKVPMVVAQEAAIQAKGARLMLVAVLADGESTADASAALRKWGVPRPFLVDDGNVARDVAGVTLLPAALVLDAQGHVLLRGSSTVTTAELLAAIP
jgi:AhpC/TSA family